MLNSIRRKLINYFGGNLSSLFNIFWPLLKIIKPSIKDSSIDKIQEMIEEGSFKLTKDRHLKISILLKGETSDINIEIGLNNLLSTSDEGFILIEDIKFSREWMNIALKNFAHELTGFGVEVEGNKIIFSQEHIKYIRNIL